MAWFGVDHGGSIIMKRYTPRAHQMDTSQGKRVTGPIDAPDIQQARDKARQILRNNGERRYGRNR